MFPTKCMLKILKPLYMHNGIKPLCKWMPDGGKHFSCSWCKNSQIKEEKAGRINEGIGEYKLMFSFIQTQIAAYRNIFRYVYVHGLTHTRVFLCSAN